MLLLFFSFLFHRALTFSDICGDIAADCDPCWHAPHIPACDQWQKQCRRSMCFPLCVHYLWDLDITASGSPAFNHAVNDPKTKNAIKSSMMAYGCQLIGCCGSEFQEHVTDWTEDQVFGEYFPKPLEPLPVCKDAACDSCHVSFTPKIIPDVCQKFIQEPAPPEDVVKAAKYLMLNPSEQTPHHISVRTRCFKMQQKLTGVFSELSSEFEKIVCACLGCCSDQKCPIGVAYPTPQDAIKDNEKNAPSSD